MHKLYSFKVSGYNSELTNAVEEYFNASESAKRLNSESRVLIKPNLLAKHAPSAAVTTHPELIKAVINALKRRNVKSITVADSPGGSYRPELMKSIYEACGIAEICRETSAQMYTECKFSPVSSNGKLCREWNFIQPVIESDFIINLPKMKTHMMMNLSCAVKNLFGCIPGLQKPELHMRFPEKERFAAMLADLYEAVKPDMNIADGIVGMEGNGPAGGSPRFCGVLLASDSAAALDIGACAVIGFEPCEVLYLKELISRKNCPSGLSELELHGTIEPIADFKHPSGSASINFSDKLPRFLSPAMLAVQRAVAPRPKIKKGKCIGCGKCAEICPASVILLENKKAHINAEKCIKCFCCHEVCPVKAIEVKRSGLFKI